MSDVDPILLQTKLHRPRLPIDLVTRTRLVKLLNQDINLPLILVCAPAGFGKTTLVSTWLEEMAAGQGKHTACLSSAWLSLDEQDSDLNVFLRYFIATLRTIFTKACDETLALLQARQQPPQSVLYATLINELERLPGEAIVVLDDYHTIQGIEVHNLLAELVRHWPKPLHLVCITRINPPLPLSSLRAKGMLSEIRTRDLRFTPEETATYLSQAHLAELSQEVLPLMEERFEGWPAGLHLATLSLRSTGSQESVLRVLSSQNQNITGYLVDEVLTNQFPAIHTFLLKTSILDRFCGSLCEAVIGETDATWDVRTCLDWIEHSELFIIPLDDRREWYRYHHLFQELLQQRLFAVTAPEAVQNLHRRASAWYELHNLLDEALQHSLAIGDMDLVKRQMSSGLRDVLNREDRPTLERWLHMLPEEQIQKSPELLMIKAWVLQFLWRHDLQAQVLQQVEELLDSGSGASLPVDDLQILRKQILLPRAQYAYFNNQSARSIDLCRQILDVLPPSWTFVRGGATIYLSLAMLASGQAQAAERMLLDEYAAYANKDDMFGMFVLQSLCFNYLITGQLEQSRQIAQVLVQEATLSGLGLMKYWGDWFLGVVCYARNELEAATGYFSQIFENHFIAQLSPYRDAVAGLTLIHQIRGESAEAWQMVESISQFDLKGRGSEDNRTRSLRARLMFMQGNLEGAGMWVDSFTNPPPDQALLWLEEPELTRARILLARGTDADLHQALQVLDVLDEIVERTHNTRFKIEILALRAVALNTVALRAQEETSQADAVLKQALELARPGDFIRVFVDLGKPMQAMLHRLVKQDYSVQSIHRILAAFPQDESSLPDSEIPAQSLPVSSSGNLTLIEPLTPRELEVLGLLRGPLSIKEIALQLNISYATAKRHTINIYGKLGVNQRWDAVAKAEERNILPAR